MANNAELIVVDNKTTYLISDEKPMGNIGKIIWINSRIYDITLKIVETLPVRRKEQRYHIGQYINWYDYDDSTSEELTEVCDMVNHICDLMGYK